MQACGPLGLKVSSRLGDDIGVRPALVSTLEKLVKQGAHGALRLGRREQDVGIKENAHRRGQSAAAPSQGALGSALSVQRACQRLCQLGLGLIELALPLGRVNLHGQRDRGPQKQAVDVISAINWSSAFKPSAWRSLAGSVTTPRLLIVTVAFIQSV